MVAFKRNHLSHGEFSQLLEQRDMKSFYRSLLLLACMTPFQFGCGESAPMTPETKEDPVEELDPATEAAAEKQTKQNNR